MTSQGLWPGLSGGLSMTEQPRLDALLAAAADRHPDRSALVDSDRTWTYAELNAAVDDLVRVLTSAWVKPSDRVGVLIPKSVEAIMAVYAALRVGAVVAPLDVRNPEARTRRMLSQAGISMLLTVPSTQSEAERVLTEPGTAPENGELEHGISWARGTSRRPDTPLPASVADGGYVLFTSGSTGWPKGVLLSHANVAHFARWAAHEVGLEETDRIGSQAALTFDLTTFDLFATAAAGACVVLMPERLRAFPPDVVDWLTRQRVTVLYAVPSFYLSMLERSDIQGAFPTRLRALLYAGEPFAPRALEEYLRLIGDRPLYNFYGPTETNVCTFLRVPPDWTADRALTVGEAVPGDIVEVLDADGRTTDEFGEVHVAGATVFQGYLEAGKLHDATREVTFRDGVRRRAYATGDLGRLTADGQILLHGRLDAQIKRHGYRIDLNELENIVRELPDVTDVAVVVRTGDRAGELWAYAQGRAAEPEVAEHLRAHLPPYMQPDRVVRVTELPVNVRGKVDRLMLAATFF